MQHRPNILFLMSDQHRADVTGFDGNAVVRTPVLDALAREGVVFRNAYTPSPICIPSRQSLATGKLPESTGCRSYGEDLEPGAMTFARRFAQYAYRTVCAGKLHHMGPDQMQGWTRRLAPDAEIADGFLDGKAEGEFSRYSPAPGTGKWSNQKEIERAGVGDGPYQRFDRLARDATLNFLSDHFSNPFYDRPQSHRPLLLKFSLLQPHYPYFTDEEKFTYYLNRVPVYDEARSEHPVLARTQNGPDITAGARDARRATAAYYGMVETMDAHCGEILDALRHHGQDLDDWIVVYTSDHGDMLGQHGIWEKAQFYEGSVRVPLVIRWPRRFRGGRTVDANVNLCDLFATLCHLAGIPAPNGLDSRSLVPLLEGGETGWPDETVSQFGRDRLLIKRGSLKYQYYGESAPEVLFDLARDPGETIDWAGDPSYAQSMQSFRERLGSLGHGPLRQAEYRQAGYASGCPQDP